MSRRSVFKFRLYVAGDAPNSLQARINLSALCETYLAGRYEIEIVDVFLQPERALAEKVFLTPTLIKLAPAPTRRIVGTLSQLQPMLQSLGIAVLAA